MADVPVQFLVAAFRNEDAADQALAQLKAAKREKLIGIEAAAVLRKDARGDLHVKEVGELSPKQGTLGGIVLGAGLGVLTGGATLLLGAAGGALGHYAGKKHDVGFKNERLQTLGASLTPSSSAIVAVIEHTWVADLENEMREMGADVVTSAIADDVAQQLAAGRDVAMSATTDGETLATGRIAVGDSDLQASQTTWMPDAMVHEELEANEQGLSYGAAAVTPEGVEAMGMDVTFEDEDDDEDAEDEDAGA